MGPLIGRMRMLLQFQPLRKNMKKSSRCSTSTAPLRGMNVNEMKETAKMLIPSDSLFIENNTDGLSVGNVTLVECRLLRNGESCKGERFRTPFQ
ncbi:hypothetical protein AVEN_183312-1 [Araneus ventricosus]|uniref:Uncharacterized protein n=1 Tax=Araneus ventricosus TaxID=182803 RepID=A0A4Y2U6U3_ARAVE|nr:hypothetical protein AVEN_183312-1 [Araneus ventricosus]